jgi:hypothetical protein
MRGGEEMAAVNGCGQIEEKRRAAAERELRRRGGSGRRAGESGDRRLERSGGWVRPGKKRAGRRGAAGGDRSPGGGRSWVLFTEKEREKKR